MYGTEDDEKMEELDGRIAATGVGRRTATLQEPERVHASRAASPMGMVMPAAGSECPQKGVLTFSEALVAPPPHLSFSTYSEPR